MVSGPLKAATRELRRVRAVRPADPADPCDLAEWREAMAEALDGLARVLRFEEDRRGARTEAETARAEAVRLRAECAAHYRRSRSGGRPPAWCENFLYDFKAARHGPLAPPPGRGPAAAAVALRRTRPRPAAGAPRGRPTAPPLTPTGVDGFPRWAGGRPGGRWSSVPPGSTPAAADGRPVVGWLRLLRLRRGRSGSGMAGAPSAPRPAWVAGVGHPAPRRPGHSRADHHPGRQRPHELSRSVRRWRPGRRPAPQRAGRRQTGWRRGQGCGYEPSSARTLATASSASTSIHCIAASSTTDRTMSSRLIGGFLRIFHFSTYSITSVVVGLRPNLPRSALAT